MQRPGKKTMAPEVLGLWKPTKEVSVMAWVEDGFGQVLMVKQARGKKTWTLPGGKVRPAESLQSALKREFKEETGYVLQRWALIDVYDRTDKKGICFLYRAVMKPVPKRRPRAGEIAAFGFKKVLPPNVSPSARYFWKRAGRSLHPLFSIAG
jgi:8-oxo-dGTP pyrophosphatase MutT (NUDIX family)